jgi:hypothetical protein
MDRQSLTDRIKISAAIIILIVVFLAYVYFTDILNKFESYLKR